MARQSRRSSKDVLKSAEEAMRGFGVRLRTVREQRQLSQQDLATLTGIHLGQISRYERGVIQPSAETTIILAQALRVSADYLLAGRTDSEPEPPKIANLRLFERFRELERMNRTEQETAITLIDALIAKHKMEQALGRRR